MSESITQLQVKSLSREDLEFILENYLKLFKTTPRIHQLASILWAICRNEGTLVHDIGTGKTLAAIYTALCWNSDRILVVCPNSVRKTWIDEIKKHTDLCLQVLDGDGKRRRALVENDFSKFHVVNYEGLKIIWGRKVPVKNKKGEIVKHQYEPDHDLILKMPYDCIIWDESHHCKSGSMQSQISRELAKFAKKRLMLTGTPVAKDIRDLFWEFLILDSGRTLGKNEFEFLHTYMNRIEFKTRKRVFYDWVPKKGAKDEILKLISEKCIRYDASECCDLPELIVENRHIEYSDEQKELIEDVLNDLKEEFKVGNLTIKNVENRSQKLCQIGSGFILQEGKVEQLKSNPKLDELVDLIETEISGKCIVVHNFVEEGRQIEERLRKNKIKFRSVRGEIKDKLKQIDDFQNDPDVKVFVAHPLSAGEGLNLQIANVIIFYNFSGMGVIQYRQCTGRIHRSGQTQRCISIHLVMHDSKIKGESLDEKMIENLQKNVDSSQAILDYIRDA